MRTCSRALTATIAAAAILAIATPSSAAPTPSVVTGPAAQSAAEQDAVEQYWTSERMQNATNADAVSDPTDAPGGTSAGATSTNRSPRVVSAKLQSDGLPGGPAVPTIGKVFFTMDGDPYVCSGNVVSSANSDVVVTAGHCVNEGPGDFVTDWAFAPAYANGQAPLGLWTARELAAPAAWVNKGDFDVDAGFAVMNTRGGQHIAEVTGSTAIGFNLPHGLRYTAFGYPAASPYDGQTLKSCDGNASPDRNGSASQKIGCTMTGGSSGGPWFTPGGVQNSVNSFAYGSVSARMYGPYFGATIEATYNRAANA